MDVTTDAASTAARSVTPPALGPSAQIAGGARAMAPWLLGIAPLGVVIGISAARADVPLLAGWFTGPLIFSGSAQVATLQLLDRGAAPVAVVLAALAVQLRLVLYSATMAPHWRDLRPRWRALAAYAIVDPTVAVGTQGYERAAGRPGHLHYLGAAALLWVAWIGAITVGVTAGAGLPAGLHLEFIIPLYLLGQVTVRCDDATTARAIAVGAALAAAGARVPLHLGILVAIAGGLGAALTAPDAQR